MQDEEIDKLITDAANQHHPPYDDKAWGKMEAMLNQHLPQKRDRRRYAFLLFFFILAASVIGIAIVQTRSSHATADSAAPTASGAVLQTVPANNAVSPDGALSATGGSSSLSTTPDIGTGAIPVSPAADAVTTAAITAAAINNSRKQASGNKIAYTTKSSTRLRIKKPAAAMSDEESFAANKSAAADAADNGNSSLTGSKTEKDITTAVTQPATAVQQTTLVTPDTASPAKTVTATSHTAASNNTKKKDNSFAGNMAFTFTAGADVSYIDINNAGTTKLFYGAGISYTVGKHLRIGAGLYVSDKVYTAHPYQYKFTGGSYNPNLKSIDADCKVYEIPLSVYYSFGNAKKHSWFAGLGGSTLLMKKEVYDYNYQTPAGQWYSYAKTYSNVNKHYFSVLTISGGYQYNLNKRLSVIAEPYLKLPLGGVGAGKIALKSTGLAFTAVLKPFVKAPKK